MTQITTTTAPGDIVVIVPRAIIRAVGFLSLFIGLSAAFLMFLAGYIQEGLVLAIIMLALVPIGLLLQYVVWRFYWYLVLIALIFQAMCYVLTLVGIAGRLPFRAAGSPLSSAYAAANRVDPVGGLLALLVAALITLTLHRVYTLWQRGGAAAPAPAAPPDNDDLFAEAAEDDLMTRVMKKLERTGAKTEIKGDTVQVYKRGVFVGIVRVIDRPGAISPLLVQDVAKQRDRVGCKTAYLATSGTFHADVRTLAGQLNVQLMTV